MKYSKIQQLSGLGTVSREKLSKLLRGTEVTITLSDATDILDMDRAQATNFLAKLAKKGWLTRIRRGVYMPVELTSQTGEVVTDEPFVIAEKLFSPCYIGGMNAANYWDLTEQIFNTVTVMTQNQLRDREPVIAGTQYAIHTLKPTYFFGLKSIWFNSVKVNISDPTRTLVDMLMFPQFCGGTRFFVDVLQNYCHSKYKDIDALISYLKKANNGAAIKRMGFLAEKYIPTESKLIQYCLNNLTEGYVKLSPSLECPRLIRRWRLWLPENWKER